VAVVGLNAGPTVRGLQAAGSPCDRWCLDDPASLLTGVPRQVAFQDASGVLLGVCAGACTASPALAAVQELRFGPID
jgi:putative transport protein